MEIFISTETIVPPLLPSPFPSEKKKIKFILNHGKFRLCKHRVNFNNDNYHAQNLQRNYI